MSACTDNLPPEFRSSILTPGSKEFMASGHVLAEVIVEMVRGEAKHPGQNQKTIGEWIILMEMELAEAKLALVKGGVGTDSVMAEICQVAAVAVQAMKQHGTTGPDRRAI